MAETVPFPLRSTTLGIVSGLSYGRDLGGMIVSSRHTEPYWSGTFTSPRLSRAARAEALAWLDNCVDLNLRVDFIHSLYKYPIGYTSSTWPMGLSDGTLASITNARTIVVSGLTAGITLRRGSRLCIIQGATVCYRKVRTEVEVSSTISQSIDVGPRIPPGIFAPGATVRLANPYVRMMVVPESWDPEEDAEDSAITFEMMESLR